MEILHYETTQVVNGVCEACRKKIEDLRQAYKDLAAKWQVPYREQREYFGGGYVGQDGWSYEFQADPAKAASANWAGITRYKNGKIVAKSYLPVAVVFSAGCHTGGVILQRADNKCRFLHPAPNYRARGGHLYLLDRPIKKFDCAKLN